MNWFAELRAAFVPDRIAITLPDGQAMRFADLDALSGRLAARLVSLDLRPGDRLAAMVEKSAWALALYLATLRAGGIFVPVNPSYAQAEVAHYVADAAPVLMVADPALEALCRAAGAKRLVSLDASGGGSLMQGCESLSADFVPVSRRDQDLAALLYTSGTTGKPKGAMMTHANLASNARTLVREWRFEAADVLIHALPIFHTHGLFVACHCALLAGARMIWLPKFSTEDVLAHLPQATVLMGVPTFYHRLLASPDLTSARARTMRLFICGSAPLSADMHQDFAQRTGHQILERYGMTEAGMITSNPYDGDRRPGSVGRPLPDVQLRVTDTAGQTLPPNQEGMIEIKGPNLFAGYWQQPEKTAADMRQDGFFVTGDIGLIEPDGYIRILGRAKELIISGGLNIYPQQVEEVLLSLPGVAEAAVFGIPHPDYGEAVAAAIVLSAGSTPDPETIIALARAGLASYKLPKKVFVRSTLPRTALGKVQKSLLVTEYRASFAAS